jgi:protoheme IX farnesyltransferase
VTVSAAGAGSTLVADYVAITKPRIVALVLVTVAVGFMVAVPGFDLRAFVWLMMGAGLVAAGSNALNQVIERDLDARMERTRRRPLPSGRIAPGAASGYAWVLGAAGVADLAVFVNLLTAGIAALTLISYVFAYTPLKRKSTLATLVGAVPGALPILGGWTAAGGTQSCFSGSCRIFSPSRGCTGTITAVPACGC